MANKNSSLKDEFTKQKEYVAKKKAGGKRAHGLVFADAFLRGMRDLGYRSPGTALDEMLDNSIQANATMIEVVFGFNDPSLTGKPDQIAIVDNGHGMIPDMIRFAVMWGGTHREGDRTGFGRYGYGLPSSAVSLAARYTVYSKVPGGEWHAVTIDLNELAGKAEAGEDVEVPAFRKLKPPAFSEGAKRCKPSKLDHGTVVVLERLDRMPGGWVQSATLKKKLLGHMGVVYRHLLPKPRIIVDGEECEPVDPLFLMESGRHYDETSVMAQPVEVDDIEVVAPSGKKGMVRIRASWLPANFQSADPKVHPKLAKKNSRFKIMKEYNGLLICRARRQIDCIQPREWTTFQNYDRNIKIEIDFDPELDEFFGITTSKQQITILEGMWERLKNAGVERLIKDLRRQFGQSQAQIEERLAHLLDGEDGQPLPSEEAMAASAKLTPNPVSPSPEKVRKATERLNKEAAKIAEETGKTPEDALKEAEEKTESHPYKLDRQALPEGPFYRPERVGKQKRLILNTAHRFYRDVYDGPDSSPSTKGALEVLLFVLADGELDAEGDFEGFYLNARQNWSQRLQNALAKFDPNGTIADKAAAMAEAAEMEVDEGADDKDSPRRSRKNKASK